MMIFLAAIFDFFDGLTARCLKVSSGIGKSLDSLADLVSFGVLPGLLVLKLQLIFTGSENNDSLWLGNSFYFYIKIACPLLIPLFSGLRLAKFDNDPLQAQIFLGLPTPANALFIASIVLSSSPKTHPMLIINNSDLVFILSTIGALLLILPVPFLSLKLKSASIKENYPQYLLLLFTGIFLIIWKIPGIMPTIGTYILLSFIFAGKGQNK